MHVCYIHQHFATLESSFGTRSYEFSKRLIAAGHRVSMICGVGDRTSDSFGEIIGVRRFNTDGIEVSCIGAKYSNSMGFYQRLRAYGEFARMATKVACGLDADLVFATSTPLSVGIPGMKASRRLGVPFVFEVRDLWPKLPIELGLLRNPLLKAYARRLERKIYSSANHIVALSPGMKEGICQTGYPQDQVTMIPNGCDLDLFRPTQTPLTDRHFGPDGCVRFVFCGAHGRANGLDAVLDAARVLKHRKVNGIQFVFIGLGSERERLIQRSKDEGTHALISWVPAIPKSELARVLPRMDVGLMILKNLPSFYYGTSPNKFFDYISSGLPVLNNYPGWVANMIRDNQCGIAVDPDDPEAFADAVVKLKESASARRELGDRARQLAETQFSRSDLATKFVDVIETTCARYSRTKSTQVASAIAPKPTPEKEKALQVIGCGGHAKVVIQTIRDAGYRVERLFDDEPNRKGTRFFDVPVVGVLDDMKDYSRLPTVIAIGDNQVRAQIAIDYDCDWATVIHPSAVVDPSAVIGDGCMILAGCVIQADATLGLHVIMNTASTVDHDSIVGDFCHLCPGVHLAGDVHLGNRVMMGISATAIPGVRIGDSVTVGAGGVVVRDVPDDAVAVGVPARCLEKESVDDERSTNRNLPR